MRVLPFPGYQCFNPPSPCGEGLKKGGYLTALSVFQSTLPVWGGTPLSTHQDGSIAGFNPPSPCGEGQAMVIMGLPNSGFNPPSPCGEGRGQLVHHQYTPGFNPPSPCGEGLGDKALMGKWDEQFQSTLPVWGGTIAKILERYIADVSIHPPRVGRDGRWPGRWRGEKTFQSTLPVWGGT